MNYSAVVIRPLTNQDQFEAFAKRFEGVETFVFKPKIASGNRILNWIASFAAETYSIYSMEFKNNRLVINTELVPPMDLIKEFSTDFQEMALQVSWMTEGNGHGTHFITNGELLRWSKTILYADFVECHNELSDTPVDELFLEMLQDYQDENPTMTMEQMLDHVGILGGPAKNSFF